MFRSKSKAPRLQVKGAGQGTSDIKRPGWSFWTGGGGINGDLSQVLPDRKRGHLLGEGGDVQTHIEVMFGHVQQ